jgi:hypothetical protein
MDETKSTPDSKTAQGSNALDEMDELEFSPLAPSEETDTQEQILMVTAPMCR